MPDLLRDLQVALGQLYDTELAADVRDYLITDAALLAGMVAGADGAAGRTVDEKLILVEEEGSVDLALYLDGAVLERLAAADPRVRLCGANLADYWTVLEGISHFNYVAWNAALDKSVTLLELEMQAEVDKYVSTRLLLSEQPTARLGAPLLQRLFDESALSGDLDAEERERYQAASRLARRYCADLDGRYPGLGLAPAMLRELRGFYRLPQPAKIDRISHPHFA